MGYAKGPAVRLAFGVVLGVSACGGPERLGHPIETGGSPAVSSTGGKVSSGGSGGGSTGAAGSVSRGGAEGGDGSDGSSGAPSGGAPGEGPIGQSWDVIATLADPDCPRIAFTLYTEPTDPADPSSSLNVLASSHGEAFPSVLSRGFGTYTATNLAVPSLFACRYYRTNFDSLALEVFDDNGDGVADRLIGTGSGSASQYSGTVGGEVFHDITAEISAVPDVTPPRFELIEPVNPLDFPTSFTVSESLDPNADVRLHRSGVADTPLLADKRWSHTDAVFSALFAYPPFSGRWTLDTTATDRAGLALDPDWSLRTIDDPGIFPEDGFEGSESFVATTGEVSRVSAVGNVPALSGDFSLLIPATASATFHLSPPVGTTKIVLRARGLSIPDKQNYFYFKAGIVGTSTFREGLISTIDEGTATGDSTWTWATPIREVIIPLPEPGDVVLRVSQYFSAPGTAALIDDLHLE